MKTPSETELALMHSQISALESKLSSMRTLFNNKVELMKLEQVKEVSFSPKETPIYVKAIRKAYRVTQAELAERTKYSSRVSVVQYEKGDLNPFGEYLVEFAKAMNYEIKITMSLKEVAK